jgi:hypothetical protein
VLGKSEAVRPRLRSCARNREIMARMSARPKKMIPEFGQIWDASDPRQSHEKRGNDWLAWMFWMIALDNAQMHLGASDFHRKGKMERW